MFELGVHGMQFQMGRVPWASPILLGCGGCGAEFGTRDRGRAAATHLFLTGELLGAAAAYTNAVSELLWPGCRLPRRLEAPPPPPCIFLHRGHFSAIGRSFVFTSAVVPATTADEQGIVVKK